MLSGPTNSGDKHWGQLMISSHSPTSIFPCSSPTALLRSPLSWSASSFLPLPHLPFSSPCPVLSSSFPISLSSIPASSCQFLISPKAAARRLDAYCCYRNRPCALDHNVTLSPRQGSYACSFLCLTRYMLAYLCFVCFFKCLCERLFFFIVFSSHRWCMLFQIRLLLVVTHLNFNIHFQVKVRAQNFICEEELGR